MAMRLFLYLIMALGFGGFAGVSWMVTHPSAPASIEAAAHAPPPVVEHKLVTILTAAHPLRAGTLLGPDDIASKEVEASAPDIDTTTPAHRDALLGGMVRQNVTKACCGQRTAASSPPYWNRACVRSASRSTRSAGPPA